MMPFLPRVLAACALAVPLAAQEPPPPVGVGPSKRPAEQQKAATPSSDRPAPAAATDTPAPKQRRRLVFGRVVDAQGNPIAGVGLILGSLNSLATARCLSEPLARTGADGRFEFWLAPPPPEADATAAKAGADKKAAAKPPADGGGDPGADGAARQDVGDLGVLDEEEIIESESVELEEDGSPASRAAGKHAAKTAETELQRRAYLQACGAGWLALQVKMPTIDYTELPAWRPAETPEQAAAAAGMHLLARIWGAPVEQPRDGIDLGKLVLRPGVSLAGRVVDDAGKPVAGARLAGTALLASSRFRGVQSATGAYRSYATSAADGSFRMPGLFATGTQLGVHAEGYYHFSEPVVGTAERVVRLQRSPLVAGKVVQADGKPAAATITVLFESSISTEQVPVDQDGAFRFHPLHPYRYRLQVIPTGESAKEHDKAFSAVLSGPQQLTVTLAKKSAKAKATNTKAKPRLTRFERAAQRGFVVSVTDRLTGRPIREFTAGSIWVSEDYAGSRSYYEGRLSSVGKQSKQPGYIRVPGPKSPGTPKGAVMVKAKGYATFVQTDLEFDPRSPPHLIVQLVPESILGGTVRRRGSTEPVPGARVYLYDLAEGGSGTRTRSVNTGTDGRFRFDGLAAGRYRLSVWHDSRTTTMPTVDLIAGEKRCDLVVDLAPALVVRGRVTGVRPGAGWKVQLVSERAARELLYNPSNRTSGATTPVQEDGSFEVRNVHPGYHEICLHIPRPSDPTSTMQIPVEPIRVRNTDLEVEVDASEDLPGRIRGRVSFADAELDPARIMVVVGPFTPPSPYSYWGYNNIDLSGARCQLRPDRTFEVDVRSGQHSIRIFDLLTGVLLTQSRRPVEVKPGATTDAPVKLALTKVRLQLKPEQEGGRVAATWLSLDVQQPMPPELMMFGWGFGYSGKRATGVSLLGCDGTLELVLPALKTRFDVYTEVARLARGKDKPPNMVGSEEFELAVGKVNEIEIKVSIPESGFEPDPKKATDAVDGNKDRKRGPTP